MKAIDAAQPSSEAVEASTPSTVALRAGEAMAVDAAEQSMIAFGRSRKASPSLPSTVKVKAVEAKAERIVKSSNDVAVTTERDVRRVLLSREVLHTENARELEDQFLLRIHAALVAVARIPEAEQVLV